MMTTLTWNSPPDPLSLQSSAVHIWRFFHSREVQALRSKVKILSLEEKRRAEQFHSQYEADRYLLNHTILREILSLYLCLGPAIIDFDIGPFGKPGLIDEQNPEQINFNLSHSGEILLIALAINQRIGIDVELIKPMEDINRMVELYFSKSENERYASLPEPERALAFYSAWTRKEAYLKSIGEGLQHPPDQVEVSFDPHETFTKIKLLDRDLPQTTHHLFSFQPVEGYQAAVAFEGEAWEVSAINYSNSITNLHS
jgi:4'-phosphopantetheinyl transferase